MASIPELEGALASATIAEVPETAEEAALRTLAFGRKCKLDRCAGTRAGFSCALFLSRKRTALVDWKRSAQATLVPR